MRFITVLLLLLNTILYGQYPQEYFSQLQAEEDKYHVLSNLPGNDVVISPIENVPIIYSYNQTPVNHGKVLYDIEYSVPQKKGIAFILDTEGWFYHTDLREATRNDLAKSFTGESVLGNVNGHGIHCGGIMASVKQGTLYDYVANDYFYVVPVKVLRNNGTGSFSQIMEGIQYVINIAPQLQAQGYVVGINLSLGGGGYSSAINELIANAKAQGIIVAAASGNTGRPPIGTPANAPDAYAVGSIDKNFNKSWFTTYGEGLYISSFGQEIYSTDINNTYTGKNGTSMACPNQLAYWMWLAMHSTGGVDEWVDPVNTRDLGKPGYDIEYGHGVSTLKDSGPTPPVRDSVTTYSIPIENDYVVSYGNSFHDQSKFTITSIEVELRSDLSDSKQAIASLIAPTNKFFKSRGFIVRPGDDYDEAVGITWYFYELLVKGVDFNVTSMTAVSEEGYPIRITEPFSNKSIMELDQGIIAF